ncbi:hypothetical protein [Streptomyces collinus]
MARTAIANLKIGTPRRARDAPVGTERPACGFDNGVVRTVLM